MLILMREHVRQQRLAAMWSRITRSQYEGRDLVAWSRATRSQYEGRDLSASKPWVRSVAGSVGFPGQRDRILSAIRGFLKGPRGF